MDVAGWMKGSDCDFTRHQFEMRCAGVPIGCSVFFFCRCRCVLSVAAYFILFFLGTVVQRNEKTFQKV